MNKVSNYNTLWYRSKLRLTEILGHLAGSRYRDKKLRREKRSEYRRYFRQLLGVNCRWFAFGNKYIYCGQEASDIVLRELQKEKPCFVGRFGLVEQGTVVSFINSKKNRLCFTARDKREMPMNAGFFPPTDDKLARFASETIELLQQVDVFGLATFRDEEKYIWDLFCSHSIPVQAGYTYPINLESPWTQYLEGKKVLVISPIVELIQEQYKVREHLFQNPLILPNFELVCVKAVQSIADNKDTLPFKDWFEALEYMYQEIDKVDFDIALIGAGAYGGHLGAYCKHIGKQAVIMGGLLQVLFGIYGQRWEKELTEKNILNEYWTRPRPEDRPKGFEKVEHGCYW